MNFKAISSFIELVIHAFFKGADNLYTAISIKIHFVKYKTAIYIVHAAADFISHHSLFLRDFALAVVVLNLPAKGLSLGVVVFPAFFQNFAVLGIHRGVRSNL